MGARSVSTGHTAWKRRIAIFGILAVAFVGVGVAPATAAAPAGDVILPKRDCAGLVGDYAIEGAKTHVTKAEIVEAANGLPAHCDVIGYVDPAVEFNLKLPTDTYKGRYFQNGCGGLCGAITYFGPPFPDCGPAVGDMAVSATNDGHQAPPAGEEDGKWGATNQAARDDWQFRAPHVLSIAAKALIKTYYGKKPTYSYFSSCSNGGREAMLLAQRYPNDFDGIVAGAPAAYFGPLAGMHFSWQYRANRDAQGKEILTYADLPVLHEAAMAACDQLDGAVDNQIDEPRECDFDPKVVQCAGADGPDCLTKAQVDAARKMYAGPSDKHGRRLYPGGQTPGSELAWAPWHIEIPGFPGLISRDLGDAYLKYLGYPIGTRHSSIEDIQFTARELARLTPEGARGNAVSLDLNAFKRSGGKIIFWHGWADPAIPAEGTLDYYQRLTERNGGLKATQKWARTFMIPSLYHCGDGSGLTEFNATKAMVDWVEGGDAPDRIDAVARDADQNVTRTRPVFPYPLRAKYDGSGSVDDPANFHAAKPAKPTHDKIHWLGEYLHHVPGPVARP